MYLSYLVFSFLLDKYPEVELLAIHFNFSLPVHSNFKLNLPEEHILNPKNIGQISSA